MRYVKNKATGEIHDREDADERCNVDQIEDKEESEDLAELLCHEIGTHPPNLCEWCMKGHKA